MRGIASLAAALGVAAFLAGTAFAGTATVQVQNVRNDKGTVHVHLYKSAEDMKQGKPARTVSQPARPGPMTFNFQDVEPGTYAISVHHDEDDDRALKRGADNLPLEGTGWSNGDYVAQGGANLPPWEDTAMTMGDFTPVYPVTIRY